MFADYCTYNTEAHILFPKTPARPYIRSKLGNACNLAEFYSVMLYAAQNIRKIRRTAIFLNELIGSCRVPRVYDAARIPCNACVQIGRAWLPGLLKATAVQQHRRKHACKDTVQSDWVIVDTKICFYSEFKRFGGGGMLVWSCLRVACELSNEFLS